MTGIPSFDVMVLMMESAATAKEIVILTCGVGLISLWLDGPLGVEGDVR